MGTHGSTALESRGQSPHSRWGRALGRPQGRAGPERGGDAIEAVVWVGIDVSKARLYVAATGAAEVSSVANDPRGVAALVQRPQALRPTLVVLEASGGLARLHFEAGR